MTKGIKFSDYISDINDRIENLEDEVFSGVQFDSDGERVYVFAYPIDKSEFMFVASDTVNAPEINLSVSYVTEY